MHGHLRRFSGKLRVRANIFPVCVDGLLQVHRRGAPRLLRGPLRRTARSLTRGIAPEIGMIARLWHGRTRARDYDAYWAFLRDRAIPDYRQTPGNQGVRLFRRLDGDQAHFLTLSYWASLEAIRAFAGADIALANTIQKIASIWSSSRQRCSTSRSQTQTQSWSTPRKHDDGTLDCAIEKSLHLRGRKRASSDHQRGRTSR
jgi:heme-degrading monooxygenase HmoA